MQNVNVPCHEVSRGELDRALDGIRSRAFGRWHTMEYDAFGMDLLAEMRDELLDHAAAALREGPPTRQTRTVLRTAAECAHGLVSLGCFPNGDQLIPFSLVGEAISSENTAFDCVVEEAATARWWVDAWALIVASGFIQDRREMLSPLLRGDYAPSIRQGVPHSDHASVSDPADLAEMDALCLYLAEDHTAALRTPTAGERAEGARRLDAVGGALSADQRLLRVLLDDDQEAFERALVARLEQHREQSAASAEPPPRTLLPIGTIALAHLATHCHAWTLNVTSDYLPQALTN
ncbi:immunity 49 family protein [Streptomyces sp. Da 82-17]|uniref:immunity 49 family protein n=1 Tax=Streptomyces sp. Da 82-17 TaxID=3377116 RepID=UPI0038D4CC81